MTKRVVCTQADVSCIIKAVRRTGLRVIGVRPDGVVLVQYGDAPLAPTYKIELDERTSANTNWEDVAA